MNVLTVPSCPRVLHLSRDCRPAVLGSVRTRNRMIVQFRNNCGITRVSDVMQSMGLDYSTAGSRDSILSQICAELGTLGFPSLNQDTSSNVFWGSAHIDSREIIAVIWKVYLDVKV